MPRYFLSYRQLDSPGHAGRVYDALVERFGEDEVFRDVDTLRPGRDFVASIEAALAEVEALVVIIGPDWAGARDDSGRPRLFKPDDFVRIEIATALERDVTVVPVLVRGARMPRAADLPDSLAALPRRQALELSDTRWRYDVGRLLDVLGGEPRPRMRRMLLPATAVALAAVSALVVALAVPGDKGAPGRGEARVGPPAARSDVAGESEASYREEVGRVCDAANRAQRETARYTRRVAQRVRRATMLEQVRVAMLDDVKHRLRASTDVRVKFAALEPPRALSREQRLTLAAWSRNAGRLRAHRRRLGEAITRDDLVVALRKLPDAAIDRDAERTSTGLRRLGRSTCDLKQPPPSPTVPLPDLPDETLPKPPVLSTPDSGFSSPPGPEAFPPPSALEAIPPPAAPPPDENGDSPETVPPPGPAGEG